MSGRNCPLCGKRGRVVDSGREEEFMDRRRECHACGNRWNTVELHLSDDRARDEAVKALRAVRRMVVGSEFAGSYVTYDESLDPPGLTLLETIHEALKAVDGG